METGRYLREGTFDTDTVLPLAYKSDVPQSFSQISSRFVDYSYHELDNGIARSNRFLATS